MSTTTNGSPISGLPTTTGLDATSLLAAVVAGQTCQVTTGDLLALSQQQTVTKESIGLGNVDNTNDANKPISIATQSALNLKVNKTGDIMTGPITSLRETAVYLTVLGGNPPLTNNVIDLSLGNVFVAVLYDNITFSIINAPTDSSFTFLLYIKSNNYSVTWWDTNINWVNNTPPVLSYSSDFDYFDIIGFNYVPSFDSKSLNPFEWSGLQLGANMSPAPQKRRWQTGY